MKKILLTVAIIAVLSIMFYGCGSATTVEEPVITEDEEVITEDEEVSTEPVIEEPAVDVDWQTLTYQWTDDSGYTFEATVKVSPWINTKNEAYVNAAWDEVGHGNSLPEFDPNENYCKDKRNTFLGIKDTTDMYYCLGELSIKNITEGWDITAENPVTTYFSMSPIQPPLDIKASAVKEGRTIGKVLFSNDITRYITWSDFNPKFNSNDWGPVPFVFAHYDRKNPNHPNGEYISEIADTDFIIFAGKTNSSIDIGIVE